MTTIQIEYAKHIEQQKHNRATEEQAAEELKETARSNRAKESETVRSNKVKELETERSNRAKEDNTLLGLYNDLSINSSKLRQNREIAQSQINEAYRSNKAREEETARHNKATELAGYITGIPQAISSGASAAKSLASIFSKK